MPFRDRIIPLCDTLVEMEFEGAVVKGNRTLPIRPGDTYLAERNTGVKLLTCRENDEQAGCVFAVEDAYPYDTFECVRVTHIDGEPV